MVERVRIKPKKLDNAIEHKTIPCVFCERLYLSPCADKATAGRCQNYMFKTGKLPEPAKARVERVRIERVKLKPKGKKR